MRFIYTPGFDKRLAKLTKKETEKFYEKLGIFILDEYNPILKNHKLHGEYSGYRSISIANDLRLIFKKVSEDKCLLYEMGTHSELYP